MKALLCCALQLALLLVCAKDVCGQECLRRFSGVADCGTVTETCTLDSVNGVDFDSIPFPSDNHYLCYRTCYENGEDGDCIASINFSDGERPIDVYATDPMYVAMKFSSPRYRRTTGVIGTYRKSNICRYHVKCSGNKLLYYAIVGQNMQDTATCLNTDGICIDRIRMIFPGVATCERCSTMDSSANLNCMDRSGLGNEMMVEFTANRENDLPGFEILANCVEPNFDQNNIPPPPIDKRQVEECTSPNGIGPRFFSPFPPPAERIQEVLDRDPNAVFRVLEGPGDRLFYVDGLIDLGIARNGLEFFPDIISLEVETPLDVRKYFRIAPGEFNGLAQLVISDNTAILVQFGVNPNLLPTEEERTIASLLDNAIADAVSDREQFDVLDELDLLEQAEEFIAAANASQVDEDPGRKKRGIEPGFIDALAIEFGNACNGVLRTSACIYQQVVMERNCLDV